MSPLLYLQKQLQFKVKDFQALSAEDKEWYKKAAEEEMKVLGITPTTEKAAA